MLLRLLRKHRGLFERMVCFSVLLAVAQAFGGGSDRGWIFHMLGRDYPLRASVAAAGISLVLALAARTPERGADG